LISEYLSDIELYYIPFEDEASSIVIEGEEYHHIVHVMKHKVGETLKVTDGKGGLYNASINSISKNSVHARLELIKKTDEPFGNFVVGIPILKNNERMEIALEKCIELGFTRFAIFPTTRSTNRKINQSRLEKISISAMKQSLNLHLPKIDIYQSPTPLLQDQRLQCIVFDVWGEIAIKDYKFNKNLSYFLFFGPEGGLTPEEVNKTIATNRINLIKTRLRTETAIIYVASVIKVFS
jgi:16S rRNA (uracil1498-N3)-methyltransferase